LLCQSGPALAIFEPGSACGMPYAPLHRRRAVGPPRWAERAAAGAASPSGSR